MLKGNAQYDELHSLRDAIVSRNKLDKEIAKLKGEQTNLKFSLTSPSNYVPTKTTCAEDLKKNFAAPILDPFNEKVKKKAEKSANKKANAAFAAAKRKKTFSVLGFLILIIAAIALSSVLIYISARWSWSSSMNYLVGKQWTNVEITYNGAVGFHLASLILPFGGAIAFFWAMAYNEIFDGERIWYVLMSLCIALASICLVAATIYYYTMFSGFWDVLVVTLLWFLFLPLTFCALFRSIVFAVLLIFSVWGIISLILVSINTISSHADKNNPELKRQAAYNSEYRRVMSSAHAPQVDYSDLYASDEYQRARDFDLESEIENRENYEKYYNEELNGHNKLVTAYKNAVSNCESLRRKYSAQIANCNLLHDSQKTLDCIDSILYYFESRRAETVKEALNLHIEDQKHIKLINTLNAVQQSFFRSVQQGVKEITMRMDKMQSAFSAEVSRVTQSINEEKAEIQRSLDNIRRENRKNSDRLLEEQKQTARTLSNISSDLSGMAYDVGSIATIARR